MPPRSSIQLLAPLVALALCAWLLLAPRGGCPVGPAGGHDAPLWMTPSCVALDEPIAFDGTAVAERRLIGGAQASALRVVDRDTGAPVAGVAVIGDGQALGTTGEHGTVPLASSAAAAPTTWELSAAGYVVWRGTVPADASGPVTLGLERGGSVILKFAPDADDTSPRRRVRLLPPLAARSNADWDRHWRSAARLLDDLTARVEPRVERRADGIWCSSPGHSWFAARTVERSAATTCFDGLPAGRYRWGLEAGAPATMTPAYETEQWTETDDGAVCVGDRPPDDLSGAFEVVAGQVRQFHVPVPRSGRICGRLMIGECEIVPQVKLYRVELMQPSRGPVVQMFSCVGFVTAGSDGGFLFDHVVEGEYLVRAWWQVAAARRVIRFAAASCLMPGGEVDLGRISPTEGGSLLVTLTLSDGERTVPPAELYPPPAEPAAALAVELLADSNNANDGLQEILPLPLEVQHELRGLAPGSLRLRAAPAHWLHDPSRATRVHSSESIFERVGESASQTLALRVECAVSVPIALEPATDAGSVELFARRLPDGPALRWHWLMPEPGTVGYGLPRVAALPGEYELIARQPATDGMGPGRAAVLRVQVTRAGTAVRVPLRAGVRRVLSGSAVAAGDVLGWRPAHWPGVTPLLCARLDATGRAVLSGLVAELAWTGLSGAPDLPEARPGEDRVIAFGAASGR